MSQHPIIEVHSIGEMSMDNRTGERYCHLALVLRGERGQKEVVTRWKVPLGSLVVGSFWVNLEDEEYMQTLLPHIQQSAYDKAADWYESQPASGIESQSVRVGPSSSWVCAST